MANRAPGPLGLVQDFVNTLDVESAEDELETPRALRAWLLGHVLLEGGDVSADDHARALELRESLRGLLLANNGIGPPLTPLGSEPLNGVVQASGLRPRFTAAGDVVLEPAAGGAMGAMGRLLAIAAAAMNDGTWPRLKACIEGTCQFVFYDYSRNRSAHWCSMEVCGNRAKARQFRQRRRSAVLR